jgi:hypothetical protein
MDGLNDIEVIVGRVIRTIVAIAQKVTRFATILLLTATAISVVSFLLGLAALDGGIRTVWIVLGIVFGVWAIGAALIGRWGVGRIRHDVPAIAGELRAMVSEGQEQGALILRQFGGGPDRADGGEAPPGGSAIFVSRSASGLRDLVGHGVGSAGRLGAAVHAITRFPVLALTSIAITLVFAFLAVIFLLALALS